MWLLMIAAANAALTITITKSKIFLPLRRWMLRSDWVPLFLFTLIQCPYCFSHWGSLFFVITMVPASFHDAVVTWLGLVALTAPIMAVMGWSLNILADLDGEGEE